MTKTNNDFNVEDALFDDFARQQDLDRVELPLPRSAFVVAIVIAVAVAAALAGRIGYLTLARGDFYAARATANVHREIPIPAYRGIITDRFGEPLVKNTSSFSVFISPSALVASGKTEEVLVALEEVLTVPREEIESRIRQAGIEKQGTIVVARGVSTEEIIVLEGSALPGVFAAADFVREYENGPAFAHVVGYDGVVRTGLEAMYNKILEGTAGIAVSMRDAKGEEIGTRNVRPPQAGLQLATTIDAEFQEYFYNELRGALRNLERTSGVGIAMNPQNGEILALISLPSFNNTLFARSGAQEEKARILNNPSQPLFNRAVSGLYNPGSTIKPLVGLAALREGVVKPSVEVFSRGYIEIPNPYFPDQPSRFVDWKPHGWVDLHAALARSSNVYFYAVGGGLPKSETGILIGQQTVAGLGIEKLNAYWRKFLFNLPSGIDVPGDREGFLPAPKEKEERTGTPWRIGDTYNVSIGQGDLLVTPIQLLNMVNAIANGGIIYTPHIAKEVRTEDGRVLARTAPKVRADYTEWHKEIREIQMGMEDAVSRYYGTAAMLSGLPVKAAGKTGSAQTSNNTKTNAFFVGYAPIDAPEISVLVLVEDAREGSLNAVPIAHNVLNWYYENRIVKSEEE